MAAGKGIRAIHTAQVLNPTCGYVCGSGFLSGLIKSARLLLIQASREEGPKAGDNALTSHGPAAIVVSVTALEVFLNEMLNLCLRTLTANQESFEDMVKRDSLVEKFESIPGLVTGGPKLVNPDVALVQHVRNEIVHFYPTCGNEGIPAWLRELDAKGLLYRVGIPPKDIGWQQKLESLKLARWCAATIVHAVNQFAAAFNDGQSGNAKTMVADEAESYVAYFRALNT